MLDSGTVTWKSAGLQFSGSAQWPGPEHFSRVPISDLKTALSSPLFTLGNGHFSAFMTTSLHRPSVTNSCQCDKASA